MSRWLRWIPLRNLSCVEAAQLLSQSLERSLPAAERWSVWLHLVYCSACRRLRRQLVFIRLSIQRLADPGSPASGGPALPPDARDRIVRALEGE